jgi:hypothetical protein
MYTELRVKTRDEQLFNAIKIIQLYRCVVKRIKN